jgi:hypothetical protein
MQAKLPAYSVYAPMILLTSILMCVFSCNSLQPPLPDVVPENIIIKYSNAGMFHHVQYTITTNHVTIKENYDRGDRSQILAVLPIEMVSFSDLYVQLKQIKAHTIQTYILAMALSQPGYSEFTAKFNTQTLKISEGGTKLISPASSERWSALRKTLNDFVKNVIHNKLVHIELVNDDVEIISAIIKNQQSTESTMVELYPKQNYTLYVTEGVYAINGVEIQIGFHNHNGKIIWRNSNLEIENHGTVP